MIKSSSITREKHHKNKNVGLMINSVERNLKKMLKQRMIAIILRGVFFTSFDRLMLDFHPLRILSCRISEENLISTVFRCNGRCCCRWKPARSNIAFNYFITNYSFKNGASKIESIYKSDNSVRDYFWDNLCLWTLKWPFRLQICLIFVSILIKNRIFFAESCETFLLPFHNV